MATVYMMIGLPASGKSTKAKEIAEEEGILVVSHDDIRRQLFGRYDAFSPEENEKVFGAVRNKMRFYLKNGVSFVHDATNTRRRDRKRLIRFYKCYNVEIIGVVMLTPLEKCIKGNKERDRHVPEDIILRMYECFDFTLEREGFDKVIFIDRFINK